jgi:hypothetical protein
LHNYKLVLVSKQFRYCVQNDFLHRAIIYDKELKKKDVIKYEKKEKESEEYFQKIFQYLKDKIKDSEFDIKDLTPDNLMFVYSMLYLPFGIYSITTMSTFRLIFKSLTFLPKITFPKTQFIQPILCKI